MKEYYESPDESCFIALYGSWYESLFSLCLLPALFQARFCRKKICVLAGAVLRTERENGWKAGHKNGIQARINS